MVLNNFTKIIIAITLPLTVGGIASYFTLKAIPTWYESLNAPSFKPPNWVFGPVWTILYILMGYSFFLIWKLPENSERNKACIAFILQLVLNFAWSFFFFYFKNIGLALIDISILFLSIVVMLILFYKVKPISAYINIPYLCWVSFALVLNYAFFRLN